MMVVMTPRETWTDERLDEFKASVNQRFDEVDKGFDRVEGRLDGMGADIRDLRQTLIHGFFVLVGINATSTLTLIGLHIL
jgi:hypothetical protein